MKRANKSKRSGIYYKPFGRRESFVVRSPEEIQELCEAPQLSQRAAYADVCVFVRIESNVC